MPAHLEELAEMAGVHPGSTGLWEVVIRLWLGLGSRSGSGSPCVVFLHKLILCAAVGVPHCGVRVARSLGKKGISEFPCKPVHRCLPQLCGFRQEDVG